VKHLIDTVIVLSDHGPVSSKTCTTWGGFYNIVINVI
jgi:hypothetical protein